MTAATASDDHAATPALPDSVARIHPDAVGELYVTMLNGAVLHVIAE